ncbi:hypothetical protein MARGE09_P2304 [Marinagarivorans cellulosilyticus]|uniref:C-factor n=1 Tax=Marinagarivorans cellulosilyticus TaxID=2721545 RepID=A0AAN2BKI0_9GAMM|nr:hypothetical protein MARGE09_P2304 [Marinagarivorans cellulosilyticus]
MIALENKPGLPTHNLSHVVEPKVRRCLVIGGGAIGQALAQYLSGEEFAAAVAQEGVSRTEVIATWRTTEPVAQNNQLRWLQLDPTDPSSVALLAQRIRQLWPDVHWLINCVGMLSGEQGPEKRIQDFSPTFFLHNCQVNVVPTLLLAQHLSDFFAKGDNSIFAALSAKVGSIEDNRLGGWYSYRSSKAALNMALKTLSIEWQRRYPKRCVVALHPGTTRSPLSAPFSAKVPPARYFTAYKTARLLAKQLLLLQPHHTGDFISWNGERLPW